MEQLDILRHAVEALERMKVPYIVVGSIASIAYGESRFTQDIDIIAAFEMKHVDELMASFPDDEFYLSESAVRKSMHPIAPRDRATPDGALVPQALS